MEKFRSVLIKRGLTFLMVVAVAIVVIIFVIPQFESLFGDSLEVPWAMKWLLNLSDFFSRFGLPFFITLALGSLAFYYLIVTSPAVRWKWHHFLLSLPVLGKTLRTYYTAQFAYLLSTLLTKNVDILNAMNIIIRQCRNVCLQGTYRFLVRSMQSGDDLFEGIVKSDQAGQGYLIPSIVQAAKVGGATASLGVTLMDVRQDLEELFESRLDRAIKAFSAIFYAFIIAFALFLAYSIGTAIMAFYENAQSLV